MAVRILVADDNPAIAELLCELLAQAGYSPAAARDGREALAAARADPPALILLDYVMPGLDGAAVFHALQADPRLRTIPVIFVTGAMRDLPPLPGIVAVVPKPFKVGPLLETVRAVLARPVVRYTEGIPALLEDSAGFLPAGGRKPRADL